MTVPVPEHHPPSSGGPPVPPSRGPETGGAGSSRPTVTHPPAPTPPRSRAGAHVLSLFAGLVLTPVGLACLAGGARAIAEALTDDRAPSAAALAAVLASALILGIVALSGAGSAVGPLVGGVLYGLVPGVGFLFRPEAYATAVTSSFQPLEPFGIENVVAGLLLLGRTASLLVLGLTLASVGLAATMARRGGRTTERVEARAAGRPGAISGQPPVPPRSRRLDHLLALALGLVVTPFALVLIAAGSWELSEASGRGDTLDPGLLLGPGVLGTLLLLLVVLAAGTSSLGLFVAGALWGLLPGLLGLLVPAFRGRGIGQALNELGEVLDPASLDGLRALTSLGVLLAWGAVSTLGALGVHGARADGRRRERAEQVVRAARRQAS